MAFGPNSTNPRQRRAYAHAKLAQLRQGETTYGEAFIAVEAASHNRKGRGSGFSEALGKSAVLLVDWSSTAFHRPDTIHHNFGGYLMSQAETDRWTALGAAIRERQAALEPRSYDDPEDPILGGLHDEHNQRHGAGYPTETFTRIFKGEPGMIEDAFPGVGQVVSPAQIEGVTAFVRRDNE